MRTKEIKFDEQQIANLFSPVLVSAQDIRIEAFGDRQQIYGEGE